MTLGHLAILLAAFTAALGFGTLLPLLPVYLAASGADALWHAGALPVVFLAAASIAAPLCGGLADRLGRAPVLIAGIAGTAVASAPFFLQHSLEALYGYQVLAGLSFGAVGPVALASLYETTSPVHHGRAVAWFGGATLAGYLSGPALGAAIAALSTQLPPHQVLQLALGAQAALALSALLLLVMAKRSPVAAGSSAGSGATQVPRRRAIAVQAALLAAFMVGGFEIAASMYVRSPLHLGAKDVALIFMACSAAMIVTQLALLPRIAPRAPRIELALGCITASAILLAVMGFVQAHAALLALAALEGATLGLAFGLLNFETAASGGQSRGLLLGYQNAASNAGQAVGSAAGATAFLTMGVAAFPALGALGIVTVAFLSRSKSGEWAHARVPDNRAAGIRMADPGRVRHRPGEEFSVRCANRLDLRADL
jgi:MFS family permease